MNFNKPGVHDYWEVQHQFSTDRDLVLMDGRVVMPKSQRKILHSDHKGWHEDSC